MPKSKKRRLVVIAGLLAGAGGCLLWSPFGEAGAQRFGPMHATGFVSVPASAPTASPTAPAELRTGPSMVLDPEAGFFAWPFPSDARRLTSGGPDLLGMPNPCDEVFVAKALRLAEEATGSCPSGCIYVPFDGPINAVTDDPLTSREADAVLLVDIDPRSPRRLSRHPFHAAVTSEADGFRPANLLQVLPVPGRHLDPATTYALIVLRRLGAPEAPFLGQHPALTGLLAGEVPDVPRGLELAQSFQHLPAALEELGIHPRDVAAATVFTTSDPAAGLIRHVAAVNQTPAPAPSAPLSQRDVYPGFTALKGQVRLPLYQSGSPPYFRSGGRLMTDGDGKLLVQGHADAPFQLTVPKGAMPAKGFPLYLYCHGTGGEESEAIDRGRFVDADTPPAKGSGLASWVAAEGFATACVAGPFSPSRIGASAGKGFLAYNFFNPVTLRDNFRQMILEQVLFRNMLLELRIDPALCPGTDASAAADGKVRFDPGVVVVGGQSLGSYLSGMLAATLDGFKGVVLTGAGGSWIEFPLGPKDPLDLQWLAELAGLPFGERLDRFHPMLTAFAAAAAAGDNTHYHRHILRDPLRGHTPPHVLVIEGYYDKQVPAPLQRALMLAVGVDFAGEDPGPTRPEQIAWALPLSGRSRLQLPVSGNLELPGGERRTAVVVRYPEDGIRHGHFVAFQREEAHRQIAEFARDLAQGKVPTVR